MQAPRMPETAVVGLTLEEAWDVAEISAIYNLTNRIAMATNILSNPEYSAQARPG
jgi:hypothetical protein